MPFLVGTNNLIELLERSSLRHSWFFFIIYFLFYFKIIWPSLSVMQSFKAKLRQQIELVANGEVRIVVEGIKPDWHNLVLTKSMFLLVAC